MGIMKMTLDMPDDLLREMKLRAVLEGRKLKDVAADTIRRGLAASGHSTNSAQRHRVKLPIVAAPQGASKFALTGDRIHELEMEAEAESLEASLRR